MTLVFASPCLSGCTPHLYGQKPSLSFSQLPDVRGLSVLTVTINQPPVTYDTKKHRKLSTFGTSLL